VQIEINYHYHGSDLIDIDIDPQKYQAFLKKQILDLYPNAHVNVSYDLGLSGKDGPLQVFICDRYMKDYEILRMEEEIYFNIIENIMYNMDISNSELQL
jgi:hypothetical protein